VNCHTRWGKPEDDEGNVEFVRKLKKDLEPFSDDNTVYSNFVSAADETEKNVYAVNVKRRLAEVKVIYGPSNLFSVNYNISATTSK
jgi:hypothetical protein